MCIHHSEFYRHTRVCMQPWPYSNLQGVCVYELGFTCKYVTLTVCVCSYR